MLDDRYIVGGAFRVACFRGKKCVRVGAPLGQRSKIVEM